MTNKITKIPQIRFNEFTGDWEQRKLNKLAEFNPKSILPDEFEYVDLESVIGTNMIGHRTEFKDSAPSRAQRLAQKNDLFYQTVRPYQKNNYLFDLPYDNYVFSTGYAQIRPKNSGTFLLSLVQEEKFVNKVLERCTGTSYPAINSTDLAQISVRVPKRSDEQTKIGSFFKQLDDTITLHQAAIQRQQDLKKAMLQKLFPIDGMTIPTVRFSSFSEEWEQRKLKEVFNQTVEYVNPKKANLELWSVTVEKGLTPKTERYNREALVKKNDKFKVVHPGDIVYNPMNMTIGSVGFNSTQKTVAVSGYYVTMNMNACFSNSYFNTWLPSSQAIQIYKSNATGSLIEKQRVQFPTLSSIRILVPTFDEQEKIGEFFDSLDKTIALHQRKLEFFKQMKKSLLQKMFV